MYYTVCYRILVLASSVNRWGQHVQCNGRIIEATMPANNFIEHLDISVHVTVVQLHALQFILRKIESIPITSFFENKNKNITSRWTSINEATDWEKRGDNYKKNFNKLSSYPQQFGELHVIVNVLACLFFIIWRVAHNGKVRHGPLHHLLLGSTQSFIKASHSEQRPCLNDAV